MCEFNEFLRKGLLGAETKVRDKAAKKISNVIEVAADTASKNELMNSKIITQLGHLTAQVYKNEYENRQTQLKLVGTQEYLGVGSDFNAQSKTLHENIKRIFNEQKLTFPASTRAILMGHN